MGTTVQMHLSSDTLLVMPYQFTYMAFHGAPFTLVSLSRTSLPHVEFGMLFLPIY
jgi:hypothetical protein